MRTNFGQIPATGSRDSVHTSFFSIKIEFQSAGVTLNKEIVCTQVFSIKSFKVPM